MKFGLNRTSADLPPKYRAQCAHLTCPATVWKYVEKAVGVGADLVMLDLEDSIPRGSEHLLEQGRQNIVRAFTELDWGNAIRTFRPRGWDLDPDLTDIKDIVGQVGNRIDGLIYPKIESPQQVADIDNLLCELEAELGLEDGAISLQVLIESVTAEQRVNEIAMCSPRLTGIIFGAFDYWGSLGLASDLYHPGHPLICDIRCKIVKAAAIAGIPAIAEMTVNFPTSDKTDAEKEEALAQCRIDARLAHQYGFAGKWTGIPAQVPIVQDVFGISDDAIAQAVREAKAYQLAEADGKGAVMIAGKMADRATDRINREMLKQAHGLGKLDQKTVDALDLFDE